MLSTDSIPTFPDFFRFVLLLLEIGIIGTKHIENIAVDDEGVIRTDAFGPRAIFGNELLSNSLYYASYNGDGKTRCFADLSKMQNRTIGWCTGDVITVCCDLRKLRIKFLLNGENVRKTMSLQKCAGYYPCIAFSGNCLFQLLQ